MSKMVHPGDGSKFKRSYGCGDLTALLNKVCEEEEPRYTARTLSLIGELGLNPLEVDHAIALGTVSDAEVTPSRTEIRLEVGFDIGDVAQYKFVVWLSTRHEVFVEDVRSASEKIS